VFFFSSQNVSWQDEPSAPPTPIKMEVWDSSDVIGIDFSPDS
jgi:hypothetical protein